MTQKIDPIYVETVKKHSDFRFHKELFTESYCLAGKSEGGDTQLDHVCNLHPKHDGAIHLCTCGHAWPKIAPEPVVDPKVAALVDILNKAVEFGDVWRQVDFVVGVAPQEVQDAWNAALGRIARGNVEDDIDDADDLLSDL